MGYRPSRMAQIGGLWMLAGSGIGRAEVGQQPGLAIKRAHVSQRPARGVLARRPKGLANDQAIPAEVIDTSHGWPPDTPVHVIDLSLLPRSPGDLDWLDVALGIVATTVLSRGFGNGRVPACAQPHVWGRSSSPRWIRRSLTPSGSARCPK